MINESSFKSFRSILFSSGKNESRGLSSRRLASVNASLRVSTGKIAVHLSVWSVASCVLSFNAGCELPYQAAADPGPTCSGFPSGSIGLSGEQAGVGGSGGCSSNAAAGIPTIGSSTTTDGEPSTPVHSGGGGDSCLPHFRSAIDDCNRPGGNLLFGCLSSTSGLCNAFVLVQVSRFQQIIGVFTLQAPSEAAKVSDCFTCRIMT